MSEYYMILWSYEHCCNILTLLFFLGTDWVDPEDPTVIAENELLTAANSIEAAAKKLSQLQPRRKAKVG